jgi:hypothetical protein
MDERVSQLIREHEDISEQLQEMIVKSNEEAALEKALAEKLSLQTETKEIKEMV